MLAVLLLLLSGCAFGQQSRHFTFHYAFSVRGIKPGQKVEIWFPEAHSDDFQDVKIASITSALPLKQTRETKHGNRVYYAHAQKAAAGEYRFDVAYDVVRQERIGLAHDGLQPHLLKASLRELHQYLGADRLVPVTGRLAGMAVPIVQGKNGTMEKARALYDYVFSTMRYDKTGTGWGRGDAEWACDSKRGNCTDFHSVFISMARSQGIPSRFAIGFPLPAARDAGEIPGYHCWAEFYDPQNGWVPIDISEAWKAPARKDYYFGDYDANRVQFAMGRDLVLAPKQAGEPLNYFVYPYVEVDGKKWENVVNAFSFADVKAGDRTAPAGR
ncbi:MAG: transglutaminase domain-containing protein [Acidobacteria bacterium]|nr:transglutaminase domain-containing protein [Acidobacteriota bacterium]